MEPKKKIFLNSFILGIILLVFIAGVLPYFLNSLRDISKDLIFFKQKFLTLQKEEENLRQLRATFQAYESHFKEIEKVFVNYEAPIQFIEFLEKNAQINQLEIKISLPSTKKLKEEFWPSLIFQISTKGSFPNFVKFLGKLENSPYLVEILNLNIKRIAKTPTIGSQSEVEADFLIRVFAKYEEI